MQDEAGPQRVEAGVLQAHGAWWFLAVAAGASGLALLARSRAATSLVLDVVALAAAGAAVLGIRRNATRSLAWLLVAAGIVLSAAGDVVYDLAQRGFGAESGSPFADVLYLAAYPCLAVALWTLAGPRRRDTIADSAIVVLAAGAAVWQWVIDPLVAQPGVPAFERLVALLYPVMDVVLVVAIVHAVFTLPKLIPAARLLVAGLTVMLVADLAFARLVATDAYVDGGPLDALWPVAYALVATAILHPAMRDLGTSRTDEHGRSDRGRLLVLAGALFAVPAMIVVDGEATTSVAVFTAIVATTAVIVAWRIARLAAEIHASRERIGESEARFRALVQHSTDAVVVIDRDGTVHSVTPSVTQMLGIEPQTAIGLPVAALVHPDDLAGAADLLTRLAARPFSSERLEIRVRHADGSWRWLDGTCTNQLHEPAVRGIVGNFRDVTERKRMERAGEGETRVLELVLGDAPLPETLHELLAAIEEFVGVGAAAIVRLIDPHTGTLRSVAAPTLPLSYVHRVDETVGRVVSRASGPDPRWDEPFVLRDVRAGGAHPALRALALAHRLRSFWSLPIRAHDGQAYLGFLGVYTRAPREPTPRELAVLERARDLVSIAVDRAEYNEHLGHLARHDTLTALPNRALGIERIEGAIRSLPESGPLVAVLFVDLDRFKVVNDGLGHDAGDELLVAVGRRIAGVVRRHDTVARFGGDEFVIVCEQLRDEHQAVELAERALDALARPVPLERAEVVVSASIGIALTRRPTDHASDLLRDADAAMYRAKSRGGNSYELFDQVMHTQAVTRLLTERALRQSLERDELLVQFQPQVDLVTDERLAMEALLRWAHPSRGLV
jgi:diguanylate cyclase (GGDEF)-like protein/PAS domain S-box-containing protein